MEYMTPPFRSIVIALRTNISNTSHDGGETIPTERHTRDMVVLIVLGVMIIAVNGLILIAFLVRRNLRNRPANIMICSQACSDLFTALVYIPVYLVRNETTSTLTQFLNCYMLYLSLSNLSIISIDRYLAMNKPFIHRRIINVSRTIKMTICVWICPLALTTIPLAWWYKGRALKEKAMKIYVFTMWFLLLVIVLSMSVFYVSASRGAKQNIKSRRTSFGSRVKARAAFLARKEIRAVNLFGLLLFFFVAAYLPILYINLCWLIDQQEYAPPVLEVISLYLLILNSILNPIICIMLKKDYLHTIKKLILLKYGYAETSLFGSDYSNPGTPIFERRSNARKDAVGTAGYYRGRKTGYHLERMGSKKVLRSVGSKSTFQ